MSKPKTDRRGQPRARAVKGLTVGAGPGVVGVQVKDISLSGLSFRTTMPLEFMTRLVMTLVFPARSGPDGNARGKVSTQGEGAVVRCKPVANRANLYEIAVFFLHLDDEAREVIEKYVEEQLESHAEQA